MQKSLGCDKEDPVMTHLQKRKLPCKFASLSLGQKCLNRRKVYFKGY